jgi:kelch-like protein 20
MRLLLLPSKLLIFPLIFLAVLAAAACKKTSAAEAKAVTTQDTPQYSTVTNAGAVTINPDNQADLAAGAGSKMVFAGGYQDGAIPSDSAYIFDTATRQWTGSMIGSHELGSAAATTSKILIGGGIMNKSATVLGAVDVYDAGTGQWSEAQLSLARKGLFATASGDVAAFAGGVDNQSNFYNTVDFYFASTGEWATSQLSTARAYGVAASAGSKMVFAGGAVNGGNSDVVDIFDVDTKAWTTAKLSEAKSFLVAGGAAGKIVMAGGYNESGNSGRAEIYDTRRENWSVDTLAERPVYNCAVSAGNLILFARKTDTIDIFNATTGSWTAIQTQQQAVLTAGASIGTRIVFCGMTPDKTKTLQTYNLK